MEMKCSARALGAVLSTLMTSAALADITIIGNLFPLDKQNDMREECRWQMPLRLFNELPEDLKYTRYAQCWVRLRIENEIRIEDGKEFSKFLHFRDNLNRFERMRDFESWMYGPLSISLNSAGGSITAAVEIAEAIRRSEKMKDTQGTWVFPDSVCHSACVIVLAGSYGREVSGEVGIHRPYFVGNEYIKWGHTDFEKAYEDLHGRLGRLFEEANISPRLIEDMFSIPSSTLRILTDGEIQLYGLGDDDMILEEQRLSEMRSICGSIFVNMELITDAGQACLKSIGEQNSDKSSRKFYREWSARYCGREFETLEDIKSSQRCLSKYKDFWRLGAEWTGGS